MGRRVDLKGGVEVTAWHTGAVREGFTRNSPFGGCARLSRLVGFVRKDVRLEAMVA